MLKTFNLLVSGYRRRENETCTEIWYLLELLGDPETKVEPSGIPGLVLVDTSLDPFKVIGELRDMFHRHPERFHYILKVTPIEYVVDLDLEVLAELGERIESKIGSDETFRITVQKRYSDMDRKEVISAIAGKIDREVDLVSPEKIVGVEILGGVVGISVLQPNDILSVEIERRSLAE